MSTPHDLTPAEAATAAATALAAAPQERVPPVSHDCCLYCTAFQANDNTAKHSVGFCRRYPPVPMDKTEALSGSKYPTVSQFGGWCREFERIPKRKDASG